MPTTPIERVLGRAPTATRTISSGVGGEVSRLTFADGGTLIAKVSYAVDLRVEAASLRLLAPHLPVPEVVHDEERLLVMQDIKSGAGHDDDAEGHAAELLAKLHGVTSPDGTFGLHFSNTIGPLPQDNAPAASWVEFFRERRLLAMARAAADKRAIGAATLARAEKLAERLHEFVPSGPAPSLIHGDLWSGNVLYARGETGRVAAFIDPSPYYAHAEMELAFIELFSTFGSAFRERYDALRETPRGERREFEATRRDLYNLYPLLVHARLFGGHYTAEADAILRRFVGE